ncbi:MAG: LytTR family DNA-binding domain-containing protein [Chitinophagaceae bacterium]
MLRAIIIDDEPNSSSALKEKLLQHFKQVLVMKICNNGKEGIDAIESLHPDLVFLDIEMPLMNGFVMLQQLNNKKFELIFTTAYDHYAIKAIRFSALDYLVKPIEIEELRNAIERAEQKLNHANPNPQLELLLENLAEKKHLHRIAIPTSGGLQFIKITDIIYLEASVNYTHIFLADKKKYIVSRTLKDFEDMLPGYEFLRIHNSYIINKNCVEKYIRGEGGQVVLSNNAVLEVSKRKKSDFLKAIGY